jgi:hypothetical protein
MELVSRYDRAFRILRAGVRYRPERLARASGFGYRWTVRKERQCMSEGLRGRPPSESINYACRQMLISDARRFWDPQSSLNWRGKDAPP